MESGSRFTLGYNTGYWSSGPPPGALEAVKEAERLGFDSLWTAEAYGSDCFTPLAWWGAHTSTIKLGTGITQLSARTPAATAMAAMTLDHLSGGRVILGLGASGPQVVEGWYGEPYRRPLQRTREYVEVLRSIFAREEPVTFEGAQYQLPYAGENATGLGKPLKSTLHPYRDDIPVLLAAEGPKNVALAAEITEGWMPLFFAPKEDGWYRDRLAEGFAAADDPGKAERFEVTSTLLISPNDDVEKAADQLRPMVALYAGGMGAKGQNFHFDVFARMGWEAEATKIQDLYLAGNKKDAIASVPLGMVEDIALVGPFDKIMDELSIWADTCITRFLVALPVEHLEPLAGAISAWRP